MFNYHTSLASNIGALVAVTAAYSLNCLYGVEVIQGGFWELEPICPSTSGDCILGAFE